MTRGGQTARVFFIAAPLVLGSAVASAQQATENEKQIDRAPAVKANPKATDQAVVEKADKAAKAPAKGSPQAHNKASASQPSSKAKAKAKAKPSGRAQGAGGKKPLYSTSKGRGPKFRNRDKAKAAKTPKSDKASEKGATARFIDRDGDGIHDGREHRFRRGRSHRARARAHNQGECMRRQSRGGGSRRGAQGQPGGAQTPGSPHRGPHMP